VLYCEITLEFIIYLLFASFTKNTFFFLQYSTKESYTLLLENLLFYYKFIASKFFISISIYSLLRFYI